MDEGESFRSPHFDPVPGRACVVNCVACGGSNPHEARFCVTCGVPLGSQGDPGPDGGGRRSALVPMELGDLLEKSLAVYRGNFRPFILISLAAHVPVFVLTLLPGGDVQSAETTQAVEAAEAIAELGAILIATIALALVAGYFNTVLSAASVAAVGQYYVDGRIDPGYCLRRAWYRIASLSGAYVGFALAMVGAGVLMFVLVGIPLFFYLLVVWFFFVECIVLERKKPMDSLWRSRDLVQGNFWRVFLIGIVYTLLAVGISVVAGLADVLLSAISPILSTLFVVAVSALITPLLWIGRTLVYYDLRVRKEQYTMDDLASDMGLSPPSAEVSAE